MRRRNPSRPSAGGWGPSRYPFPWMVYFGLLNALLSYSPLSLAWKLGLGFFGLILPLLFSLLETPPVESKPPGLFMEQERDDGPPAVILAVVFILGVVLRIYKPLTFIPWPLYDEAVNGYYAMRLDQHWTWTPFFFWTRLPPLFIWLLFLLSKGLGSILDAIRWEPILISLLVLPLAYGAARSFFSRRFSFLYLLVVGLSFGFLFFARISHQGALLLLWEFLALFCLGKTLKAPGGPLRYRWLALLGLVLGTGFYTYFAWPLVALWLAIIAWYALSPSRKNFRPSLGCMLIPAAFCLLPFLLSSLHQGYGSYFQTLLNLKGGNDWTAQVRNTACVLASFLWGCRTTDFYYGPVWGGFLNPLMGGAFLVGMVELYRQRRQPQARVFFLGMALFLLPAFLTNNLTDVREIEVLPLLAFAAALGLGRLVEKKQPRRVLVYLGLFMALSTALDSTHLLRFESFLDGWLEGEKTAENAQAFRLLDQIRQQQGPGLVLTSFSNDLYTFDKSLPIAVYPFNAASNPRLAPDKARWLAVVTNVHFQPFLAKRYPGSKMVWLSDAAHAQRDDFNGGLMLMVVPLTEKNRANLTAWVEADRIFQEMSALIMSLPAEQGRKEALSLLAGALPTFPKDPFLRSCYWELVYSGLSWEYRFDRGNAGADFQTVLETLQRALREGYPTAYFYNELGSCYALRGEYGRARQAFENAIHAPLNLTPAADNLKALRQMEKNSIQGKAEKEGSAAR